jgi:hypothetical protein
MSWTYVQDFTTTLDQVRFLIQDTQSTRPLCTDEELTWLISTEANVYMAAAAACELLIAKAGNVKTRWIGDLRVTLDTGMYRGLASMMRARGAGHQVPFAGGISVSDKQEQQDDTDAVQPRVFKTLLDNQRADQPTPGANNDSFQQVP